MIQPLPWPDAVLDRASEPRSDPGFLDTVQARPGHRIMVLAAGKTLVRDGALVFLAPADIPAGALAADTLTVYLGSVLPGAHKTLPDGTDIVLKVLADDAEPLAWVPDAALGSPDVAGADGAAAVMLGYRQAALGLEGADAGIFIEAQGVANWHRTHPRCPRCGAETTSEFSGWMRRCTVDGSEHFPRTDPAVIVAVIGADDRILLANNAGWDSNRYSTVAGFVESGESLEQAVVREIFEEVGVRLHTPVYVGSQAWPFPRSLMLGYLAYTDDAVPVPDGREVLDARWFSRTELQDAVTRGDVIISQRLSIARALIEHWYGGVIADAGEAPDGAAGVRS
jgi:NAD+ diphosphatase